MSNKEETPKRDYWIWNGKGPNQIMTPFFEWIDGKESVMLEKQGEAIEWTAGRAEIELKKMLVRDQILGYWLGEIPKELLDAKSPRYPNYRHPIIDKILNMNLEEFKILWFDCKIWTWNIFYPSLTPNFIEFFETRVKPTNELASNQHCWKRIIDVSIRLNDKQLNELQKLREAERSAHQKYLASYGLV